MRGLKAPWDRRGIGKGSASRWRLSSLRLTQLLFEFSDGAGEKSAEEGPVQSQRGAVSTQLSNWEGRGGCVGVRRA